MRVAYLCHRIPYPPNKGEKIRAFRQLEAMAGRHEVDLFTLADDAADMEHRDTLLRYCRQVTVVRLNPRLGRLRSLPYLLTRTALTVPYFYSAELDEAIRRATLQRSYDRIFVYCSAMAQYVRWDDQVPVVTDLVDVDSDKWTQYAGHARFLMSAIYRREGRCLREYERGVCERSSSVLVATEREAELLREICGIANVHVICNGVDTEFFKRSHEEQAPVTPTIVFTGDMGYFPNEHAVTYFARNVLPVIHKSRPDARFVIVGRNPGRNVRQLKKIPGVKVTGAVPDVRTYLEQASVAVAPFSIAAGIQNKVLEALAYGLPVVATPRAIQGLSTNVRAAVDTGRDAEELAAKTLHLLEDRDLARRRGIEGRRQVTADYNWGQVLDRLLRVLEDPARTDTVDTQPHSLLS